MIKPVVEFRCTKDCSCESLGRRLRILSGTLRDADNEVHGLDIVPGEDFLQYVYPEGSSIVVCSGCNKPWTMDIRLRNHVVHEGNEMKFLSELRFE